MHLTIIEMQFKLIIFKCKTPIFTINPAICSSFTSITLQSCTFYNLWLFSQKISSLNKATIQACPGTGDFAGYSNCQPVKKHETLTILENVKSPAIFSISASYFGKWWQHCIEVPGVCEFLAVFYLHGTDLNTLPPLPTFLHSLCLIFCQG